jgi:hypothetical protein
MGLSGSSGPTKEDKLAAILFAAVIDRRYGADYGEVTR